MRVDTTSIPALRTGLEDLADLLESVTFRLPFPGRTEHERGRGDVIRTVREYLVPRLRDPDAPVVAAIVGPTGSGKSTVMNSLAQDRISETGVLRPTTKSPVLWAHRSHAGRYWSEFVARVRHRVGPALEVVVGDDQLTANLTLIDTPAVDLESEDGTLAAREVLSLSDMCVFVTSAARYADASAWGFLVEARGRGVPVLFVLNRLPADVETRQHLLLDYARRLHGADLLLEPDPSLVFAIQEGDVERWHGGLQPGAVGLLRKELGELSDPEFRHSLVDQTTYSSVRAIANQSRALATALREEAATASQLEQAVDEAYGTQSDQLAASVRTGGLGWVAEHDYWPQAAVDLTGVVTRRAGDAAQAAAAAWASDPTGARFLEEGGRGLWRHGHDSTYETQRLLEEWAEALEDLAVNHSKAGRLGNRARSKAADRLWGDVLRGEGASDRFLRRKLGDAAERAVAVATDRLVEVLDRALRVDAARFVDFLGDPSALRDVDERLETRAGEVLELIEHPGASHEAEPTHAGVESVGRPEDAVSTDRPEPASSPAGSGSAGDTPRHGAGTDPATAGEPDDRRRPAMFEPRPASGAEPAESAAAHERVTFDDA